MRKLLLLFFVATAGAAHAQVFTSPWFSPPAPFQENFDSITAGTYTGVSIFSFPAAAYATTAGGFLQIGPPITSNPPAFSLANTIIGVNSGVGYKVAFPMKRFGGYFRTNVNSAGTANTNARLIFYDAAGNVIGFASINLGPTWTQFTWQTVPKWSRVEVYGAPFGPGGVEMDSIWVRPS
jgi:hypothetical protein